MGQVPKPAKADSAVSRRALIHAGASAGFITAAVGWSGAAFQPVAANAADPTPVDGSPRQLAAFQIRQDAAQAYLNETPPMHMSNGDEGRYVDKRASFSKTLPHNDAGEVDVDAFETFVKVLTSGEASGFETVPRDRTAEVALNDPQATYAFDLAGLDSAATALDPAPAFSSALMASEMAEIYWLSLTRDVPFREYERDPLILAALSDINAFSEPLKSGAERGAQLRASLRFDATPRFMCSARELAEYVHRDFSFQAYMNAALISLALGKDALSPTNPYRHSRTQFGDITLGNKNVLSMLAQAALLGQKGAYFHKWQVHRRLRPECFAGRIETHSTGRRQYDLHADILHCDAVARTQSQYGTRLLPVAFPEGSPTHPSYPSAHACNAGACATILKAFFDSDYVLPHPVEASADGSALDPWRGAGLSLGNALDKLASNIALGRDAAGVHYRSDSVRGLFVGEQQALGLLRDYSRTYNERFDGFIVRKFNGDQVKITNGELRPL